VSIAAPANAITTGQLPVLTPAQVAEPATGRHSFDNPDAISVVELGGKARALRGPRAHKAPQVGNRGWRLDAR
jgi:hypothetical protein